ncbi:MAG: S9 family peptidase [Symbiobacteriaceae bacterium]|nr:S9 family peptidase [Symbiobacteriaceae bacterium]
MRKITIQDLYSFKWVADPNLSPDGSKIIYTHTHIDEESKEYRTHLYMVYTCGTVKPRKISGGTRRDTSPRWSPCGNKLAFVSDRSGEGQIWMLSMDGGEATQVTTMRYGAGNPTWSPDGKKLAFTARMHPTDELDKMFKPMSRGEKDAEAKYKREHGLVVESLQYRSNDAGFLDGRYTHIWVLDIASGKITKITDGNWHHQSFSWAPCSSKLVLSANRTANPEDNTWNSDLYVVSAEGGELKQITSTDGPCGTPSWSPDGTKIAYLGHTRDYAAATISKIWIVDTAGGTPYCLTQDFDQGFAEGVASDMTRGGGGRSLIWLPCSSKLVCNSNHHGRAHMYTIDLSGKVEQLTSGDRAVYAASFSENYETLAIAWGDMTTPNEIAVINLKSNEEKQLTNINPWLDDIDLSNPKEFWLKGDEGWDVQAWLMKPAGWQEGKQYPMILNIHGGPHSMFGYSFFHEFQVMASQGFYVLFLNPRGGSGYGQIFQHGVNAKYGEGDYRDLMLAVDHVLAEHKDIDSTRLGVTGGSYGGYMTNWIIGHTDRFKAAVTQRSISNWISFFGVSDIGFNFCDTQLGGNPLDSYEAMVRFSPLTYVKNVVTPLLIIHAEQDYRCPIEQGEQLFVSLKKLGQEVKMVRFNNATHELSRSGMPPLRIDRLTHMLKWFTDHIEVVAGDYRSYE